MTVNGREPSNSIMGVWANHKAEILIGLAGLLAVSAVFIVNAVRGFSTSEGTHLENLGAFVGGCVGSLFSLGAMLLLFVTLELQRESAEFQNFETKYFALLTLHRANVAEMKFAGEETGRRTFLLLLGEVRRAHALVQEAARRHQVPMSGKKCLQAAYYAMFYGVGTNSERMLRKALLGLDIDGPILNSLIRDLNDVRNAISARRYSFDGHQSRLGHYYRHLYQMVRYVDQQDLRELTDKRKYEYVKTIRAQLSTHEQALLLLNSLTPMGHNWWDHDLIEKYQLVKNLPQCFFDGDNEIDIETIFPQGYFEWQENQIAPLGPRYLSAAKS